MKSKQLFPARAESPDVSNTAAVPMNPEPLSPATEASQDQNSEDSLDRNYVGPKWLKPPPKVYKPYLTAFTLFPSLPIEIRQAIWKCSLTPRVVEITFTIQRGFYSIVKIPVALRVNKDSRNAIGHLYPLCFGNNLHPPRIVFNFSIDTLYFDTDFGPDVSKFVISLKQDELNRIRYIAIDRFINDYLEWGDFLDINYDSITCLQKITSAMPAIQETLIVVKLDEDWHEHGFPEGIGQIELMDSFSYELQQFMLHEIYHFDEDGGSECQKLPDSEHLLEGFDVPKKDSIWGWRPTKLL